MDNVVILLILVLLLDLSATSYDEESTEGSPTDLDYHDDPITTLPLLDSTLAPRNINCDTFTAYAVNCTMTAALKYNSSRKAPPLPSTMFDWCSAMRHLTTCAKDWNLDCKDVTNNHFNEESIAGHDHVVKNICDDDTFLLRYEELPDCIDSILDRWEACYTKFKLVVDKHKNTTREWTHYEQHFYLCCAKAQFRNCTLSTVFKDTSKCSHQQGLTVQRFSVVVSEGDVYQDCTFNMDYTRCPGGDPRPRSTELDRLELNKFNARNSLSTSQGAKISSNFIVYLLMLSLHL